MKTLLAMCAAASVLVIAGCGGDGGGQAGGPPPPPTAQTYTTTLTDVELVKKGGTETLAVDSVPADGATLTRNP